MRMLFEMDKKDYSGCTHTKSAASVISPRISGIAESIRPLVISSTMFACIRKPSPRTACI